MTVLLFNQRFVFGTKYNIGAYDPEMRKFYYTPEKYGTYLEQLGIKYPTIREGATQSGSGSQN